MPSNLQPIVVDADIRREQIRQKTMEGLKSLFPIIGKRSTLELHDLDVNRKDFSNSEQKDALLSGRTLHEALTGTIKLRDNATGKITEEKKRILVHLPYFTKRYTFVVGGNEYTVPNQLRLKSGVYTRERNNGEFEAAFNLSKGSNFRLAMEPSTGRLNMEVGGTAKTSKLPLYAILKILGVSDTEIKQYWGNDLTAANSNISIKKEDAILTKIVSKIKRTGQVVPTSVEGKRTFVRDYFHNTAMDPTVTNRTLGVPLAQANAQALLVASKKLIDVHKGSAKPDDRDSLEFKTLHATDDFFKERLDIDARRTVARKILGKLNQTGTDISSMVPNSVFTKSINGLLTSSDLSSQPTQINPIEILDYASKITSLGEGGISSDRAINFESRKVHNSHFGIIDPVHTPDGPKTGIDIHSAMTAHKDDDGNLYAWMRNHRSGRMEHVSVMDLAKSRVAFPGQEHRTHWDVLHGDSTRSVLKKDVDYVLPNLTHMFSPATALVPFLDGMQGNRAIMGSKFQAQALPLVDSEAPYVQAGGPAGGSMENATARLIAPTASIDGTVEKIDGDYVYIRPHAKTAAAAPALVKIPYNTYFPLAAKTYLHDTLHVKVGDTVKQDDLLGESNFTRNGATALGKNLSIAYMAYYGKNSNDAVVISAAAAKKLTSEHMYKEALQKGPDILIDKAKYLAYYGLRFTNEQLSRLDENGVAKKGASFHKGDPLILGLRKAAPTPEQAMLGMFHKSMRRPYKDVTVTWDKDVPATVQDVTNVSRQVMVTVRTQEPMKIGDKLSNRFGGKGVVSEIIPDNRMVQDESKRPIDVLFTSAGIVSRINPCQVVEAALGKVAEKTGKPVIVPQFQTENNVEFAKRLMKEHGVKDKETVHDPVSGKDIPNVFVGRSYIHKLFKSTETNYSARGVSGYDSNLQPTKGGDEGAKGLGRMEINALLAHNARNVLKEALTLKSEKSDDFWRAYEFGLPAPPPKTPFVTEKFISMLQGSGINVNKEGAHVSLGPLTDRATLKLSTGALTPPNLDKSKSFMVNAKNLAPESGGLFDPYLTGGMSGTKWSHLELAEPIVNPVFEDAVRRLLGLSKNQLKDEIGKSGGIGIRKQLNALNLNKLEENLREQTRSKRGTELDGVVKQLKYIEGLRKNGFSKAGDAYVISKVPVIPPVMRPIVTSSRGNELQIADINYLYRDVGLASSALQSIKETEMPEATSDARKRLHETVGSLFGTQKAPTPLKGKREYKGFIEQITGTGSPKTGFLFKKILRRQQDLTGRATATPDNTLGIDQVGVPEDMLWTAYEKFIMRGLIGQGYKPIDAKKMVENRHFAADAVLKHELTYRPMFLNRAPSLHRHNIIAAYPVPVQGKSLRINPFMETGQNLDYDGDAMQLHVPVTTAAVHEAQQLTMSKLLFGDKNANDLMVFPKHEAILGAYLATKLDKGPVQKFKTQAEAMQAYQRGDIKMTTPVEIAEPHV